MTMDTTQIVIGPDRMLDVRHVPCSIKHDFIVKTFCELPAGEFFILRNGHDPVPLRYQFDAEFPGTFSWEYVHQLPGDVAVKISKVPTITACAQPAVIE
jgi:uncharacterized protein (DUF2249 family)